MTALTSRYPRHNRFARWPTGLAQLLLAALLAMIVAAALVPITVGKGEVAKAPPLIVWDRYKCDTCELREASRKQMI